MRSKEPAKRAPKRLTIDDCKVTRNGDTIEIHLPFKRTDPRYPWVIEDHEPLIAAAKKVNAV